MADLLQPSSDHATRRDGLLDWGLIGLFIARSLTALPIAANPRAAHFPDSQGYLQLAYDLADGVGYQNSSGSPIDLLRPPAYPAFLSLIVNLTPAPELIVVALQILISGLMGLIAYWIGARIWSRTAGRAAAALVLLSPNLILWSLTILSDILFGALLVGAAAVLAAALHSGRVGWLLASGALAGLAVLARPIGLPVLALWALIAAWGIAHGRSRWRAAAAGGLFVLGVAAVVLPWSYRNHLKWGYFQVSSIGMRNLSRYMAAPTLARAEELSLEEARQRVPSNLVPLPGELTRGLAILLRYPGIYLDLHARGTYRTLTGPGRSNLAKLAGLSNPNIGILDAYREGGPQAWLEAVRAALSDPARRGLVLVPPVAVAHLIMLYGVAAAAVFSMPKMAGVQRTMLLLFLLTAAVLVLLPGPVGNSRFRVPAEPFLALAAGAGIENALKWLSTWRAPRVSAGAHRDLDGSSETLSQPDVGHNRPSSVSSSTLRPKTAPARVLAKQGRSFWVRRARPARSSLIGRG